MSNLQFTGTYPQGSCHNTTNRNFTMTEEADICYFSYQGLAVKCYDNVVKLYAKDDITRSVQVFAVADNVYVAHQFGAGNIYLADNLQDVLAAAAEIIYNT